MVFPLEFWQRLQTTQGQADLAQLQSTDLHKHNQLVVLSRLHQQYSPDYARLLWEVASLRRKATLKFTRAERMFFDREGLEMATAEPIARYRAERFRDRALVYDLGCGLGGDGIALAERAQSLHLVDNDECRLFLAKHNIVQYEPNIEIWTHPEDILSTPIPAQAAVFADPSRRVQNRRQYSVTEYLPPLFDLLAHVPESVPLAVKMAPGITRRELDSLAGEIEFISWQGELREAVLWRGSWAGSPRRATILPQRSTFTGSGSQPDVEPGSLLGEYIYDPDSSLIRSGLLGEFAASQHGQLAAVSPGVALLHGEEELQNPFVQVYRCLEHVPVEKKKLQKLLQSYQIGKITPLRRGVGHEIRVDEFCQKLKLKGENSAHLIFTRLADRPQILVVTPVVQAKSQN